MTSSHNDNLPRNLKLPLFDPHVRFYDCAPMQTPQFDAQADAWFREARELESPEIYIDSRDYPKIVSLTRQAAERQHWQAILNLASLYLEGRSPPHGAEDAVQLVEQAITLGVPAAFDRMGTYYMNGTGVQQDASRAYAFWQQAANMGSPEALTFLGEKLISVEDHPERFQWANEEVGTKMLECAYRQGYGEAAYELAFQYSIPTSHAPSRMEMTQALKILHEGVKYGCQKCAASLASEFSAMQLPSEMIAPNLDKARAERYRTLSRALDFDPSRRFPNLDKILPLPPAQLPPWNGDRDTLINAARGVSHPPSPPSSPSALSERKGRFFLHPEYRLSPTDETSTESVAPFAGYWQPVEDDAWREQGGGPFTISPGLYQSGERFDRVVAAYADGKMDIVPAPTWRLWRTVRHDLGTLSPPTVAGRTREVHPPLTAMVCSAGQLCPESGVWQPWLHIAHPRHADVNQYWRQAWVVAGQRFPDPHSDWLLAVGADDVRWHLMDGIGIDLGAA